MTVLGLVCGSKSTDKIWHRDFTGGPGFRIQASTAGSLIPGQELRSLMPQGVDKGKKN